VPILAANVALDRGQAEAARELVEPLLGRVDAARAALHNTGTLARELPLLESAAAQQAVVDYLVAILPTLAEHPRLGPRLHQRALEHLAETCVQALEHDRLGDQPAAAADRFGELLALVRAGHPESAELYAAQIALARYERDRLRRPLRAAERLEKMLLDLDLPLEGVALARLALGESYLAARDTARARQVLTALGRDPEFRAPAGHAHFLLAKLDLAQGHLGTSRDRFAAVALDNPAAPYANDALQMGLTVAEELQNPTGGPDLLLRYARAVWWDLAAEPDSQRVALERYLERAAVQVDLQEPQPLLERARLELARLERQRGRIDAALQQLERIVLDQPDGRLAPAALALRGEILAQERGDAAAARREYERLLVQYPDYLFATEIRQRLKELS
jgi:tetratricopeptide (TPR) repeat protein